MSDHHRNSPSGADKWFYCSGSLNKEEGLDNVSSEFSSEGTAAHTVRERCLTEGLDVQDLVGEWVTADELQFEVTREWAYFLQPGIDRIREAKGFTWVFEHRVKMDPWIPGGFGTLDAGGISKKQIIIDDLKFGRGVTVEAVRCKQLMIYALGFWQNYARHHTKATSFLLRIDQPRVLGKGSEWEVSLDELLVFAEELAAAVKRTFNPDAPLRPSPKGCQFCLAARHGKCEVLDAFVLELLGLTFDDLDDMQEKLKMDKPDGIDAERRARVIEHAGMISSWVSSLRSISLQQAILGNPDPGLKAVGTLGDRSWKSEQEAQEFWNGKMPEKDIYTKKLKSPAQMELISGTRNWAKAEALINRPDGPPALVPVTDPRPALLPLANLLDDLSDMDDDEDGDDDVLGFSSTRTTTYDDLI